MLILNDSLSSAEYEGYLGLDVIDRERKKDKVSVLRAFPTSQAAAVIVQPLRKSFRPLKPFSSLRTRRQ